MDLCDRREIQALLERHGFHFSKAMGQNFLIESWVPRDIADSCGADEGTGVLEIGPGIGPVQEHFSGLRPILCANLPYNITTPVLTKCVESRCFDSLTVLIQKEVAQRICAEAGTAEYGAFTVLMQYYTAPQMLFTVPASCFLPAPKVTSAVIHCPVRKTPPVEVVSESALWRTVKAGFALRRKTLVNSLQTGYQLPKERLAEIVTDCGLSPTVRGERLTLEDFARLTNALFAAEQTQ